MHYSDSVYLFLNDDDDENINNLNCLFLKKRILQTKMCNINYNNINKITRKCVKQLQNLTTIDLSFNKLNKFYKFISSNDSYLTELILNNNEIKNTLYINNEYSNLKLLNLNYNKLTNIYINLKKLTNLYINNNKLIDVNVISNEMLTLDVSYNNLSYLNNINVPLINKLVASNNNILNIELLGSDIDYSNNKLSNVNINNNKLIILKLNNNLIEECKVTSQSLLRFEASNNKITNCILNCENLINIDLHINNLIDIDISKCVNSLSINLSNNKFTNDFNIQKFSLLFPTLLELNMLFNKFEQKEIKEIQECPICLSEQTLYTRFIYCGHSICNTCYKYNFINCPLCRANNYKNYYFIYDNLWKF